MRGSFQILDLQDFNAFMVGAGYVSEPTNGDYEVARYRMPDPRGDQPPAIVYRRKNGEMTVWPNGNEINYLVGCQIHALERKSPQVVKIEAGEAITSPASAEDTPW
jgi:hypothetical protein